MVVLALLAVVLAVSVAGCGATQATTCADVEYGATGTPELIVASDLPLQGAARTTARQINSAIRAELKARSYAAGVHTVGFQACDDSTADAGKSDAGTCSSNANAYADNDQVIGVIGTLDSRCAAIVIPVLNQAPGGGIPMVSPTNTYPCLTRGGAGCDVSEPDKYYPSGKRNYLRVVANDVYQGAASAEFARSNGVERVFVLHDGEAYGVGVATNFRNAATSLGIEVVGFEGWDPAASSYKALFEQVRSRRPDAVFLGGLLDQNGAQVIADKVSVLGPNDGSVQLLASDGFSTRETPEEAGVAANGMFVVDVGVPRHALPEVGRAFATKFARDHLAGESLDANVIYGAQAARVMLDAIAKSDGTRADVTAKLFETTVTDGLLGTFRFDANGDPADAAGPVAGFTIYEVADGLKVRTTIDPEPSTVRAAERT